MGMCQGSELPTLPKFSREVKRRKQVGELGQGRAAALRASGGVKLQDVGAISLEVSYVLILIACLSPRSLYPSL